MEENINNTFFTFDSPKGQSSYIKVIGVGGGGGNAVNHMYKQGIEGVDFIVCNTDMKALNASPVPNKIPLGDLGLGAGNKPERARQAAEGKADVIREAISHNTQMLFITAGMGGGTGTGAAPVIAEIAKSIDLENDENKKILVVAIVTRPFSFEGKRRREQAEAGIAELRKHVDSIIVINNDKLRAYGDLDLSEAFGMADDVLLTAAKGIAEIITVTANVNIDFQDVNTVMEHSGTALMGTGSGSGDDRAMQAIEGATTSVLLDDSDIRGAKNVLLYFSYSSDHKIKMDEIGEITDYISDKTDGSAEVIWGAGIDDSLGDSLKVTLIATGFEKTATPEPEVHTLVADEPKDSVKPADAPKPDDEGMVVVHREPEAEPVKAEPVAEVKQTPEAEAKPAPAEKHVFVLEDDEPVAEEKTVREVRNIRAGMGEFRTEIDSMVDDIHLVEPEVEVIKPEPKAEIVEPKPEPKPAPEPFVSAFRNDNDVATAADRIRRIHDLLRNNANGADIVQRMPATQMSDDILYEGQHSAAREASSVSMRADGTLSKNPYLYGNQPD